MRRKEFDVSPLVNDVAARIVFIYRSPDAITLEHMVKKADGSFKNNSRDIFAPKKVGPFKIKNKTSIWNILYKTKKIQRILAEEGKEEATEFLEDCFDELDLIGYESRAGHTLSYLQREKVFFLHSLLNGEHTFLLSDCFIRDKKGQCETNKNKEPFVQIVEMLENYEDFKNSPYDLIWLTNMEPWKLFDKLGKSAFDSTYSYYFAKDEEIILLDSKLLEREFSLGGSFFDLIQFADSSYEPEKEEPIEDEEFEELARLAEEAFGGEHRRKQEEKRQRNEEEREKYEAEKQGLTRLKVLGSAQSDSDDLYMVYACIHTGSVGRFDRFQSTRTGTKYEVMTTPINASYIIIQQGYEAGEIDDEYLELIDCDIKTVNKLANEELAFIEEGKNLDRRICADPNDDTITVGLLLTPYKDDDSSEELVLDYCDLEEKDILLSIKPPHSYNK